MMAVPRTLYRGMSATEYHESLQKGYIMSDPDRGRYAELETYIQQERELQKTMTDPEEIRRSNYEIKYWEEEQQMRESESEFDYTFFADTFDNAKDYGPIVISISTEGIESFFTEFRDRPGEWITSEPIPVALVTGVYNSRPGYAAWKAGGFMIPARRADVHVRTHRRRTR